MRERKQKRFLAHAAAFLIAVLLMNLVLPNYRVVHAAGTTPIGDSDITNVSIKQNGNSLTGELDYIIPDTITEDTAILTYDFSKVYAYKNNKTKGVPALDFSKYDFSGPILVENSYYYKLHKDLIDAKDYTALKAAGYPYWYTFSKDGVVELDYRAIFTYNDDGSGNQVRDYDSLVTGHADSFVAFTCDLNDDAFDEAGGEFILSFVTDLQSMLNPKVKRDEPKTLKRDIEVTKECASFDFNGRTVQYTISVKNYGAETISAPIVFTDTLDEGLTWKQIDSIDNTYLTYSATGEPQVHQFTLNNLPAGATTTVTYTCELNKTFYRYNQNHLQTNGGNTVTATAIPDGGDPTKPVTVELNPAGDTSIRAIPTDLKNYKEYVDLDKVGTYTNGVYE